MAQLTDEMLMNNHLPVGVWQERTEWDGPTVLVQYWNDNIATKTLKEMHKHDEFEQVGQKHGIKRWMILPSISDLTDLGLEEIKRGRERSIAIAEHEARRTREESVEAPVAQ